MHFSKAVGKEHSRKGRIRKWFCAPGTSGCVAGSENLQVIVHSMCHFIECIFILCAEVITDNSSERRAIKTELRQMICELLLPPGAVHRSLFVSPPGDLNCSALEVSTTWRKDELGFGWWRRLWGAGGMKGIVSHGEEDRQKQGHADHRGNPKRQKVEQEWLLSGKAGQAAQVPPLLASEGVAAGRDFISLAQTPDWPLCILSVCH